VKCERAHFHGGKTNIFLPTVWTFEPNAFPQPLQNLTVKLAIDGLTRRYEFLVDNALGVDKRSIWTWHCCELNALFWPRWIWRLSLRRLQLILRVITIHPCFITSYDIRDDVEVVSGLLFGFPVDRIAKVVAQQSWHKSRRNASHVQIVCQNALNGPVRQSYNLTNIVDSLLTICNDSLAKFRYVFRCCACRRSSRRLIVVDRRSSALEGILP